jgi:hypothetical protein
MILFINDDHKREFKMKSKTIILVSCALSIIGCDGSKGDISTSNTSSTESNSGWNNDNTSAGEENISQIKYEVLGVERVESKLGSGFQICVNLHVTNNAQTKASFNLFGIKAHDNTGVIENASALTSKDPQFDPNVKLAPSQQHRGNICFDEPEPNWKPTKIEFSEPFENTPFLVVDVN